jgi:hypothetical protein
MNEARDLIVKKNYHESFQKLREIWDFALEDYRPFLKAARQLLEKDSDDHSALYIVATEVKGIIHRVPTIEFEEKLFKLLNYQEVSDV